VAGRRYGARGDRLLQLDLRPVRAVFPHLAGGHDDPRAFALASFVMLFHPNDNVPRMMAVIVLPAVIYGVVRHTRIAPPKSVPEPQPATT